MQTFLDCCLFFTALERLHGTSHLHLEKREREGGRETTKTLSAAIVLLLPPPFLPSSLISSSLLSSSLLPSSLLSSSLLLSFFLYFSLSSSLSLTSCFLCQFSLFIYHNLFQEEEEATYKDSNIFMKVYIYPTFNFCSIHTQLILTHT